MNLEAAVSRASVVLRRMHEVGFIDEAQLQSARQNPARIVPAKTYANPGYFLDWAYEETLKDQSILHEYVIEAETTIDQSLQAHAREVVKKMLKKYQRRKRVDQGALAAITSTGAVKAIVGGRDYDNSRFNRTTKAMRQPGSSFKSFVYLAALQAGMEPDTKMVDEEIKINGRAPKNHNKHFCGPVTLTRALRHSINTIPIKIVLDIGAKEIFKTAKSVGYKTRIRPVSSMALGANETTVMNITGAYATFANGGKLAKPYVVAAIRRPNGDLLYSRAQNAPKPKQVIRPDRIADLNYMMNEVIRSGTGRKANLGFTAQAGKTGTTQSYRDAWFVGFTGHLITGVWHGNDDASSTQRLTGGDLPAMTWREVMQKALSLEVARALPGLPLNERHARYNGNDDVELLIVSPERLGTQISTRPLTLATNEAKKAIAAQTQKTSKTDPRECKASTQGSHQSAPLDRPTTLALVQRSLTQVSG